MREINEIRADYKNYINLVKEMIIADFKLRYQGSFLGILWTLIQPLMLFTVLYLVFSVFARFNIRNYSLHLLLGITLWGFFSESTSTSITSLIQNARLIKKIYFPRSIIPLAQSVAAFINFLFTLAVFFIFLLISRVELSFSMLFIVPLIIYLFLITLGVSFIISSLSTLFRDLKYIWPVILRLGFWLTPITYSIEMVPEKFRGLMYVNPMTSIIQLFREALLHHNRIEFSHLIVLGVFSVLIFLLGQVVFSKRSEAFPEEL